MSTAALDALTRSLSTTATTLAEHVVLAVAQEMVSGMAAILDAARPATVVSGVMIVVKFSESGEVRDVIVSPEIRRRRGAAGNGSPPCRGPAAGGR